MIPNSRLWRLVALVLVLGGLAWIQHWRGSRASGNSESGIQTPGDRPVPQDAVNALLQIESREREIENTVWKTEIEAERYEDVLNELWNRLNAATNSFEMLGGFAFRELILSFPMSEELLPHAIHRWTPVSNSPLITLTHSDWLARLREWGRDGWTLAGSSWREIGFQPASQLKGAVSLVNLEGRLKQNSFGTLATLSARLEIAWEIEEAGREPRASTVRVRELKMLSRGGPTGFEEVYSRILQSPIGSPFVDPILCGDLDGDGSSEILAVGANLLLRNQKGRMTEEKLASLPSERIFAALLIDWNGDGRLDLCVASSNGIQLFENNGSGRFESGPRTLWTSPSPLKHPQVMTAGQVRRDGTVAIWVGQYKLPYQGGQFPTPYYDANDGFPGYLLLRKSDGSLEDATIGSGLEKKRYRRCYSASFVDLNDDGDLDLVMISDFAGMDVFLNNGQGVFKDVTGGFGDSRHLFGMAHTVGDFNRDGRLDILAMGMGSTVASRLTSMKLVRPGFEHYDSRREAMTAGNRLFLGTGSGLKASTSPGPLTDTGWSWGVSFFDADNDGDPELAVANGHETAPNVKDYERQFWLHDLYLAGSTNDTAADLYFRSVQARRAADRASYGGWQANTFFLNLGKRGFEEAAFLLGLGFDQDSQNLLSEDVDGDGRIDLILTTYEKASGRPQSLRILRNRLQAVGNWIGLRLDAAKRLTAGVVVRVESPEGTLARWIVNGDSYRSQHSGSVHFGLGRGGTPTRMTIEWPARKTNSIPLPLMNQWHSF